MDIAESQVEQISEKLQVLHIVWRQIATCILKNYSVKG